MSGLRIKKASLIVTGIAKSDACKSGLRIKKTSLIIIVKSDKLFFLDKSHKVKIWLTVVFSNYVI
jgi:hypothetical protein